MPCVAVTLSVLLAEQMAQRKPIYLHMKVHCYHMALCAAATTTNKTRASHCVLHAVWSGCCTQQVHLAMDNTGTEIFGVASDQNSAVFMGTTLDRSTWTWSDISGGSIPAANTWSSIAANGDGTKLLACKSGSGAGLFVGTFSGSSWSWATASITGNFQSVAVNDAGDRMFAAALGSAVQVSLNSGVSWASSGSSADYQSIATDGAGSQLIAVRTQLLNLGQGNLWKGTFSGGSYSWSQITTGGLSLLGNFRSVASSRDGNTLVAAKATIPVLLIAGDVRVSTDAGANWSVADTSALLGLLQGDWTDVAIAG
jgi:hypothetical protein